MRIPVAQKYLFTDSYALRLFEQLAVPRFQVIEGGGIVTTFDLVEQGSERREDSG